MANKEVCELYIEQQIKAGLDQGKNPHAIGKEITDWVHEKLGVDYSPRTIEQRARRDKKKNSAPENATFVASPTKIVRQLENRAKRLRDDFLKAKDKLDRPTYENLLRAAKEYLETIILKIEGDKV